MPAPRGPPRPRLMLDVVPEARPEQDLLQALGKPGQLGHRLLAAAVGSPGPAAGAHDLLEQGELPVDEVAVHLEVPRLDPELREVTGDPGDEQIVLVVAGGSGHTLRLDETLGLEEADLGDRHVGEVRSKLLQCVPDGHEAPGLGSLIHPPAEPPVKKTSLNLPIWISSPLAST